MAGAATRVSVLWAWVGSTDGWGGHWTMSTVSRQSTLPYGALPIAAAMLDAGMHDAPLSVKAWVSTTS